MFGAAATNQDRLAVAARIVVLNAVIQLVCNSFPGCSTDRGAMFALWPSLSQSDLGFDLFHLSGQGEAKLAAATWAAGPFSDGH